MKKLFCLLLSAAVILSFAGCGKKKAEKKYTTDVDVEYYVRQGQLPECGKYALGYDVDKLTSELDAQMNASGDGGESSGSYGSDSADEEESHSHDEDGFFWFLDERDSYTGLRTGSAEYCYRPDKRQDGISAIVSFDAAFGFETGTISIEIKEALSDFKPTESTEGNGLPFLPADGATEYLTYKFAERCVTFAFYENALCGTAVYDSGEWSIK